MNDWTQVIIDVATDEVFSTTAFRDDVVKQDSGLFYVTNRILVLVGSYDAGYIVLLRNDENTSVIPSVSLVVLKRKSDDE